MSAKRLTLFLVVAGFVLVGAWQLFCGLRYALMSLVGDPPEVLLRLAASRALIGVLCLVPAIAAWVMARESH